MRAGKEGGGKGALVQMEKSGTLATNNDQTLIYENHAQDARYTEKTTCPTVTSRYGTGGGNVPLTIYTKEGRPRTADEAQAWRETSKAKTLNCFTAGSESRAEEIVATKACVRRLTPVEVERLQGFPDNYTRIPYRGNPESECPDGPRYKAIGNSWAVPVVRWIGKRINKALGR